jgi:hypothetical protein
MAVQATITGAPAMIALGGSVNLDFSAMDPNALEMGPLVESWTIVDGSSTVVASGTGGPFTFTPTALGTYTVQFTAGESTVADGETGTATATITVTPAGPTVLSRQIDDGTNQRSLIRSFTFKFSSPVTLSAGAITLFQIQNLTTATGVDASAALGTPTTTDGGITWVVPILASSAFSTFGSLTDGVYQTTVHASLVTDGSSQHMAADNTGLKFHRMFGDFNGDKKVNATDYLKFSGAFGAVSPAANYLYYFDYNHDNKVNATDYLQFSPRFGKTFVYSG